MMKQVYKKGKKKKEVKVINRSALSQSTDVCHSTPQPETEQHSLYTSREVHQLYFFQNFLYFLYIFFLPFGVFFLILYKAKGEKMAMKGE